MVLASFAEIISIGSVLPFLAVLTEPNKVLNTPSLAPFVEYFHIQSGQQLLLPLTILFGLATLFAAAMRMSLIWANTRLTFVTGAEISYAIYQRTLYQDYSVHLNRNSSVVIDGILNKSNAVIWGNLLPTIIIISSSIMLVFILTALIYTDPQISLIAFSGFGVIYTCVLLLTKNHLKKNGQLIFTEQARVIKSLQEGLGGIRDVLIDGTQEFYCRVYQESDLILRRSQGSNTFLAVTPRFLVEALGMLFIAALAYYLSKESGGMAKTIPTLGVLALSAQKLVPILQEMYVAWTNIRQSHASLNGALELLDQPLPKNLGLNGKTIAFNRQIVFDNVSFSYLPESQPIFEDLTFAINKGERIGIIGETGCGKSTMLDLVMGLLHPTLGSLIIDDCIIDEGNRRAWQKHIAHVPQAIYLADTSIAENIAFGEPKENIDLERVKVAAIKAQIHSTIENLPQGYGTLVGERGVRLSGGQRQRIGIARALYKEADVIIFDEATSALDNETEESLMQTIESLQGNITILMIAHRLTTLRKCDRILELQKGGILQSKSYSDVIAR
jgi:ATP-binding cassette subfamily B protein